MSYDSTEVLAGFTEKYGITYRMLSDQGSAVIRSLGILNEQAAEAARGIPHPGVFVLDRQGNVREKRFYASYRERDTGVSLLERVVGIAAPSHGPLVSVAGDGVAVRAWLDADHYTWGQRIWLTVQLTMEPAFHVYGRPIPDGYYPVEIRVEPIERVAIGEPQWPEPKPFRIEGLEEEFRVYEGELQVSLPMTFMVVDGGDQTVRVQVSYQACTAAECLAPVTKGIELKLPERPLVERPKPQG